MQPMASGDKTSAGHGKTGEPKAGDAGTSREPKPTSRTAMTSRSYESAPTTSWNNLPVNTTTEASVPASNSDQETSDCISGVFVWPTGFASAASALQIDAPGQGQTLPRLPAASNCWPARNLLTIGTTARHDIPVNLVWLARRDRHQGRARQGAGRCWNSRTFQQP